MTTPLIARLLLDAQEEFLRAVDHVPAPGRGKLGRLNAPGWVVAHAVTTHDGWLTRFAQGGSFEDCDAWCGEWYQRQAGAPIGEAVDVDLDEAIEAARRVFERTGAYLEQCDAGDLARPVDTSGTPWEQWSVTAGYMIARSVAHLYSHAGELTVIASLVRAGDLGLPGPLPRSSAPSDEDDPSARLTVGLLRSAYVELRRVASIIPQPAVAGTIDRLNPAGFILGHALQREDRLWNVRGQGREADAWLVEEGLTHDAEPRPVDLDAALEAYGRVTGAADPWLASLDAAAMAGMMETGRGEAPVSAGIARSAAHLFSHAGELQAIASVFGASDVDLPGHLQYCLDPPA